MATADNPAPTIDGEALGRWMDAQGLAGAGTPSLSFLSGGTQNDIYAVERDGLPAYEGEGLFEGRAVVRLPTRSGRRPR